MIAGGAVRAVMTSAGMQNVLTKSIGTTNPHNVIKATFDALKRLKNKEAVAAMRGKTRKNLGRAFSHQLSAFSESVREMELRAKN